MQIKIDGKEFTLPASINEVTIGRRVQYDKAYGQAFREELKSIIEIPEEQAFARNLALAEYHCKLAFRTVAFFGGVPDDLLQQVKIEDILVVYETCMITLSEEINFLEPTTPLVLEHEYNGDMWQIAPPELTHQSKMTFGEFLDAKQVTKDLIEFGNDNWDALLRLCTIYFRKKGERYDRAFSVENSERYKLLYDLPLDCALHVGFFFLNSMNTYLRTYHYST